MIITIDGPAGTGKSTVAKLLAEVVGFDVFDTGAMYRAFTWHLLEKGYDFTNHSDVEKALKDFFFNVLKDDRGVKKYFIHQQDITEEIRTLRITKNVSQVAALKIVRKNLVSLQRAFAKNKNVVFEGRDMGTVVFPKADLKIFLNAAPEVRALRRYQELLEKFPEHKDSIEYEKILDEIKMRDHRDSTREISPLKCAQDAYLIDTSEMSIEQVVDTILEKGYKPLKKAFLPKDKMRLFYRFILRPFFLFFHRFYHFRLKGRINIPKGAAIIAANHASYFDPPAVAMSFLEEVHFLGKKALFRIPVFSSIIRRLNTHPISGASGDVQTIKDITRFLKQGKKVVIFPEGSRNEENTIGDILPGVGFLAYLSKAPIVPFYIEGSREIWPRGQKLPKWRGTLRCSIGKPISIAEFSHLSKKDAIDAVNQKVRLSLIRLQQEK